VADGVRSLARLPRPELRAALRRSSPFEPPLEVLAEDVLGAEGVIDLVGVDPEGRVVAVLVGEPGQDRELVTRGIAQRAWLRPRLRDWLKLQPALPFQPEAPVSAWLLCASFCPDTVTAAADLGTDFVELFTFRCVQNGSEAAVLVDRVSAPRPVRPRVPTPSPGPGSRFRSGLSEQDLGLSPEEIADFE
jgi:hypothetical protein